MLESKIEKKLKDAVESVQGLYIKLPAIWYIGIPDRLILLPGSRIFFAELKKSGKNIRRGSAQAYMRKRILALGAEHVQLSGLHEVNNFIRQHIHINAFSARNS